MNWLRGACWCWLAFASVGPACGKRPGGGGAAAGGGGIQTAAPAARALLHAGADLPAICDEYRRKLLRCMESSHFPRAAKEGQRLALEQMLEIVRQEQRGGSGLRDTDNGAAAAQNCRDSLGTLEESAKVTCPGAL